MTFTNYHIAINKADVRPSLSSNFNVAANLEIEEVKPDFEAMLPLLERVGGPWDWPRREGYLDYLKGIIEHPDTRMMLLKKNGAAIGYCLANKQVEPVEGIGTNNIGRIENYGLFLEETAHGYGKFFLPRIFEMLFQQYDAVYLTTRSTNHPRVVPFYKSLGMTVIKTEELEDDLVATCAR